MLLIYTCKLTSVRRELPRSINPVHISVGQLVNISFVFRVKDFKQKKGENRLSLFLTLRAITILQSNNMMVSMLGEFGFNWRALRGSQILQLFKFSRRVRGSTWTRSRNNGKSLHVCAWRRKSQMQNQPVEALQFKGPILRITREPILIYTCFSWYLLRWMVSVNALKKSMTSRSKLYFELVGRIKTPRKRSFRFRYWLSQYIHPPWVWVVERISSLLCK